MKVFKGLLFLFAIISLVAITQASVPLHDRHSENHIVDDKGKSSQNILRSFKPESETFLTSVTRSSNISIGVSYYSTSDTCQGTPTDSYDVSFSDSIFSSPLSLYDVLKELLKDLDLSVFKSTLEQYTAQITGCGNNMDLKLCGGSNCIKLPLDDCIDIPKVIQDYIDFAEVGITASVRFGLTGPACSGVHCFTADSKLILDNFQQIQMSSVQIGQQIMTYDTKTYQTKPTKVIGWLDRRDDIAVSYLEITHELGKLKVSPYHLLGRMDADQHITHVFATDIKKGDKFLFHNTSDTMPTQVTHIRQVNEVGAFAPLTSEGTYLVNGVLASCYAHFASHNMAHVAFAPYRWYYSLTGNLISPQTESYIQILKATLQWSRQFRLMSNGIVTSK
ncbi:hypothetical protein GAYE_HTGSCF06PCTG21G0273 [Galdieria yellowstonensis]|uniref:Hedgehog protein n=1 Tax=Galdieria yellowstonensis TaxID=3028027 RepID=A0AAV9I5X4_9RHOD|nr:hypothetical protein GAYE_HTGSCF06PCTG21G0273 [Galdieria yellowstonensis]